MTGRGSRLHKSTKLCSYATTFKSEISDDMSEDDSSEGDQPAALRSSLMAFAMNVGISSLLRPRRPAS
jgi:hypothetical protein